MGISQTRTRERLEADRRRQADRKNARSSSDHSQAGNLSRNWQRESLRTSTQATDWNLDRNFRFTYGTRKDPRHRDIQTDSNPIQEARPSAKARLSFSRESADTSQGAVRSRSNNVTPRNEWRPVIRDSQRGSASKSANSHASHASHASQTPSPSTTREGDNLQKRSGNSKHRSEEGNVPSQERRSALNRISLPQERIPLLQDGVANTESGRLQEVDIHLLEEPMSTRQSVERLIPSSSRNPILQTTENYDPSQDRSPIRSLSEDRLHVSLRLGPLRDTNIEEEEEEEEDTVILRIPSSRKRLASTISRADKGKGLMPPPTKKRVCRSPLWEVVETGAE
ncbi:hypothetical protein Bca101_014926 [Brassica carinata]